MHLRILRKVAFKGIRRLPGEIIDIDNIMGTHLISHNLAEDMTTRPSVVIPPRIEEQPLKEDIDKQIKKKTTLRRS